MRQPTPPQRAMPILATRCVSVRIVHAVRVAVLAAVLGLGAGDLAAGRPAGLDPQDTPGDDRPTRAIGQRQQQGGADLPIDPLAITGEGFGPVVLPAARDAVAVGEIRVAGQRAWAWRVPWPSDEAPATDRLLLEGDVRLVMGTLELHAQRMHAWVQDLPDGAGRQFFVLLEDASMPAGAPGVGIAGPLLPIEGRLAPDGRLGVSAIVLEQAPPPPGSAAWTAAAVARGILADRLRELVGVPSLTPVAPDGPAEQAQLDRVLALARARLGTAPVREPILPMRGSVSFSASRIEQLRLGDGQDGAPPYAVVLRGPVTIQFSDRPGGRYAQLTAQDAVIFHKAQLVGTPRLQADDVLGVYLEGEVVADVQRTRPGDGGTDHYRVRSPRVYYDLAGDQALLLEAVFRAQPVGTPTPIYVRAMEIRQRSLGQLQAAGAQVTTTGFFRPHLALGASTLTLNIDDGPPGRRRLLADARHVTAQVLGVPVLYWPVYVGDPSQIPLRNVSLEFGDRHGEVVRTTWDGFALLGAQPPAGVDLDLLIDAYFRRGPGLGGNLTWTGRAGGAGSLLVYGVVNDTHRDLLPTGARIDRTGQGRTVALLEHIGALNDRWTLRAEGAWLSDENVVGAYFPQWTTSRREPTNALSVQRIDRSSMLLLGASVQANDFLVTDAALRSRGYAVERLPELRYARPADDLLADARPGLITLRSDSRAGLLRMRFTEPTAAELGFPSVRRAQAALGIDPSQSPGDRLRAQGLDESAVFRATTEHELSGRVDLGPLRLRPFAVGRLTGYDTDFDDFAASTGRDADALVASGGVGLTASTELTRIYDGLFVPALDIDRLRHVVEPSATLWYGDSTVAQGAIPTFDEQVERFARGPAVRIGVDQTFQTMRGSLGTQQSVDLLRVGLHVVFAGRDRPEPQRTPRFDQAFVHRSELGDFADLWAAWRVTDALGLTGRLVYDLQADRAAEAVAGVEIDHWPATRLFAELRRLGYSDDTYANAGVQYELSDRYTLRAEGTYNDKSGQFQSASLAISRRMPHLILTGRLTYDDITGQTSLGVDVVPAVADTAQQRIDRLGSAMLGLP